MTLLLWILGILAVVAAIAVVLKVLFDKILESLTDQDEG